jgi:hypothetical protein
MTDKKSKMETEEFAELLSKLDDQTKKDFIFGVVKGMVLSLELSQVKPEEDNDSDSDVLGKAS